MGGVWGPGGYPISQGIWTLFSFRIMKKVAAVAALIFVCHIFYDWRSVVCRPAPVLLWGMRGSKCGSKNN